MFLVTWKTLLFCGVYIFDLCRRILEVYVVKLSRWVGISSATKFYWKSALKKTFSIITFSFLMLQPWYFACCKHIPISWFCYMDIEVLFLVYVQSHVLSRTIVGKISDLLWRYLNHNIAFCVFIIEQKQDNTLVCIWFKHESSAVSILENKKAE